MKTYLFNTEALGGYMLQGNPHKRMLKTEVQGEGEGEDRVVVKLNEIRSSDLEFDSTQTLQIVDDEIVVVPRPPAPVVVPQELTRYQFLTQLSKQGDLVSVTAFVSTLDEESQTRFDNTSVFKRAHVLLNNALPVLAAHSGDPKWTQDYIDTTFVSAAKITD